MTRPLSQRAASAVLVLATAAAACTGDDEEGTGMSPDASEAGVRLVSTGGDVFAWEQRVEGTGACDSAVALVDGEALDVPVEVEGDEFSFVVPIHVGEQQVAARCTVGGVERETDPIVFSGMLESRPTARITVGIESGKVVLDGSRSEPSEPDGVRVVSYRWEPVVQIGHRPDEPRPSLADGRPFGRAIRERRLTLTPPTADGEYFVSLTVGDAEGHTDTSTTYFVVEGGRPRTVDLMREHPSWIDTSIVYAPVHQIWGGGAKAVEERLPYLRDLGVDALWLWPPVTTRALGEQYAIVDYFSLDEEWGTEEDFRSLVGRAHELGLRVLIDVVPNHSSIEHRYYRAAEHDGPGSHYWDFYDRKPNGEFTHYFDWEHLPNLNYDNPQVRRMITEFFSYWITEYDVDGFRVDAAWGIKRRRPDYWTGWREELKRIKPDLLLLAEATARDPYYFENGFDVGYDWTMHPGQWPWASLWDFRQEIQSLSMPTLTQRYPKDARILRFLNNNDTGVRFAERHGPELTKVASALQFTVPGIPLMFGGDEVGVSYQPYGVLEELPWKDRFGLRLWYEGLIALRERQPAILGSDIHVLTSNVGSVISYARPAARGGGPVLVVLNFWRSGGPTTIVSDPALEPFRAAGVLEDALTGQRMTVPARGDLTVPMPGYAVRILVPAGGSG